jgi:LacI family transcriptional regulator
MVARLKDIAQDLGLSVVTISKVLRNHPDIGEQTRKRVLDRMKELNYQPNFAARSLITGRTWTIGLVVPDLLHPFFAQIAKGISVEVRKKGYSLFISSSDEDPDLEQQEIAQLLARRVDVMLIASSQWTVESFRHIEERKIPYILLDRQFPGFESNFVGVDDTAVGVLATTHLIEQGCRRIAHIRGPEISTALGRMNGYKQALASRQITPRAEHVVSIGPSGDHEGDKAASTIRWRWAPCAPSSTQDCAFPKTSPSSAAAIFCTPIFSVFLSRRLTRTARCSARSRRRRR